MNMLKRLLAIAIALGIGWLIGVAITTARVQAQTYYDGLRPPSIYDWQREQRTRNMIEDAFRDHDLQQRMMQRRHDAQRQAEDIIRDYERRQWEWRRDQSRGVNTPMPW